MTAPLRAARHAARAAVAPPQPATTLRFVPITAITRRVQARGGDPPPDVIEAAAREFAEVGLSQPVRLVTTDGLSYTLVSGNTRLLAAEHLGWTVVPALVDVVPAITDDVIAAAMRRQFSEHRVSRPMTVWQTACYVRWLIEDRKLTHRAIVAETRMSSPTVHRYKRLLRGAPYPDHVVAYLDSTEAKIRTAERLLAGSAAQSALSPGEPPPEEGPAPAAHASPRSSAGSRAERAAAAYVKAAATLLRHPAGAIPAGPVRAAARQVLEHLESA